MTTTAGEPHTGPGRRFAVDADSTVVEFDVKTFWGLGTVHGRFDRFDGFYEIGPTGPRIELTVDAGSLDTGNGKRDEHLRSDGFFDVAEHERIRFVSTQVHANEGATQVEGRLSAAGEVVPLVFDAAVAQVGDDLEIEATTTVDQRPAGGADEADVVGALGHVQRPVLCPLGDCSRLELDATLGVALLQHAQCLVGLAGLVEVNHDDVVLVRHLSSFV